MMANFNKTLFKRINPKANPDANTGFGTNSDYYGGRFYNKNGIPNSSRVGLSFWEKYSIFHTMLQMPIWKFLTLIFLSFLVINLLFAIVYYMIGVENLAGIAVETPLEKFAEAFFFSSQTLTTVGYGRLAPVGFWMSLIASIEALLGLLGLALATGLIYGRFSKPEAFIKFSNFAVIAPYKDTIALMMRLAPYKDTSLTDAEAKVTLGMILEENGAKTNKFYSLDLELSKINALNLSWTIVHAIDEKSPLYGLSIEDLKQSNAEFIVFFKAFDENYSNTVVSRSSYTAHEIKTGVKFKPMYHRTSDGKSTKIEMQLLDATIPAPIESNKVMLLN